MHKTRSAEPANLRVVATGLRFPEGPIALADGSVLVVEIARGTLTRVQPDGVIEVVADCGGGPNGAAVGPDGAVYVCNNGGCFDWQERFGLTFPGAPPPATWPGHGPLQRVDLASGAVTTVLTECGGYPVRAPNDLVFDVDGGIWFTDHGVREERTSDHRHPLLPARWQRCLRGRVPGRRPQRHRAVAGWRPSVRRRDPHGTPLGLGCHRSRCGERLGSGGTARGRVGRGPGRRHLLRLAGRRRPGLDLRGDARGQPRLTAFSPGGDEAEYTPLPDPLTTNICFALEGRTAFATLSGTGQLVAFDWPRPGGRLPFAA